MCNQVEAKQGQPSVPSVPVLGQFNPFHVIFSGRYFLAIIAAAQFV
jgi:hypothetical protein